MKKIIVLVVAFMFLVACEAGAKSTTAKSSSRPATKTTTKTATKPHSKSNSMVWAASMFGPSGDCDVDDFIEGDPDCEEIMDQLQQNRCFDRPSQECLKILDQVEE